MMGVWPLNESVAIGRSRDKLRSMQLLARAGIGLPVTAFAHDPKQTAEVLKLVGGAPVIIKLIEGTQGIGVVLGETESSAKSVIEAFRGANVNILVQEFIQEANGTDIRVFVIGGKAVAAIQRKGSKDDFRSNLHRGGSASAVKISPEERSTALRAAKTIGLNVCGVDLLRSRHGPVVMEVNSSPGPGRHREGHRPRHRRRRHRFPRAQRPAEPDEDEGARLGAAAQAKMKSPAVIDVALATSSSWMVPLP